MLVLAQIFSIKTSIQTAGDFNRLRNRSLPLVPSRLSALSRIRDSFVGLPVFRLSILTAINDVRIVLFNRTCVMALGPTHRSVLFARYGRIVLMLRTEAIVFGLSARTSHLGFFSWFISFGRALA